jgi:hypothetical protein
MVAGRVVFWRFLYESGLIYEEATLLGESTLFMRVFSNLLSEGLTGPSEAFGGGSLGSEHARLLRGFAPAGERRRYPKT